MGEQRPSVLIFVEGALIIKQKLNDNYNDGNNNKQCIHCFVPPRVHAGFGGTCAGERMCHTSDNVFTALFPLVCMQASGEHVLGNECVTRALFVAGIFSFFPD